MPAYASFAYKLSIISYLSYQLKIDIIRMARWRN